MKEKIRKAWDLAVDRWGSYSQETRWKIIAAVGIILLALNIWAQLA